MHTRTFLNLLLLLTTLLMPMANPAYAISFDFNKIKATASKLKKATGKISTKEEVEIGGLITSTLLGAAPLVNNTELQSYINQVGMWIAQHTDRPDLPWKFGIIDSDNINAFAAPGGYIILTKGLFMILNNEAELAAVLAHEIGHVTKKHHLKALQKNARLDLFGDALQAGANDKNKSDRKKLNKLINAGTHLYARGLDRKDEYTADRLGAVYAARAGYSPYALLDVLTTLDSVKSDSPQLTLLTKTHPPFSKRIELLDIAVEGQLDRYSNQLILESRFLAIQKTAIKKTSK